MKTPLSAAVSGFIILFPLTLPSFAADQPLEIVITAGRKSQPIKDTLAPVTVITREDIKRWQVTDVVDVLRRVPSLNVVNQGGAGKLTTINLRGSNANQVLVLVDGAKVGSATTGLTAFEFLPLDQIERIEVVRGPRSSLYGSEAIGGVIQIFTRRDSARGFKPSASMAVGTDNTRQVNVNLAGGNGRSWFNANAGYEKTDGINALALNWDGTPNTETDKDGFESQNLSLRTGHRFNNGATVEMSALRAQGENQFDGTVSDREEFVQQVLSAKGNVPLSLRTQLALQLSQTRDERDSFQGVVFSNRFDTQRNNATVQLNSQLTERDQLTLGLDDQTDKVDSTTAFTVTKRNNQGYFLGYQKKLGKTQLDTALRYDDNEQFGSAKTGSIGVGRALTANTRATLTYGTAFKAPTFNDLYFPNSFGFSGNPNLNPEKARNIELGLQGNLAHGNWYAQAFHNNIKDLINYEYDSNTGLGTMNNVDKAKIKGIELGFNQSRGAWQSNISATYQQPKSASGSTDGKWLVRRPQTQLKLDLDRSVGRGSVGASLQAFGKRYEDTANTQKLGGYATVDLRAQYPIGKAVTVGVKIGNVLDKHYETARGYNQLGRNGLVTLNYTPK
ncbi:TonB-dependent receptor domain-containing protein [Thiofilum flexile]|uniref:TonB-dependent receptor domain-containing protein n=1 Tax=Thiofilum flexile TaxID=125627 RepID=UPI00036F44B8|nr:TonB-dependent receptor [Thiofilum flexile]